MASSQISRRKSHKRQLDKQKELGLCGIPYCKYKPKEGHTICSYHIKYFKERYKKNRTLSDSLKEKEEKENGGNTR